MPRPSKEKIRMTNGKVFRFLMERPLCQQKFKICCDLLQSILKTRSNNKERRDKYILQLTNTFKRLCSDSTDLLEAKEKLKQCSTKIAASQEKRSDQRDYIIKLENKLKDKADLETRLESAKLAMYSAEKDNGILARENEELKKKLGLLKIMV